MKNNLIDIDRMNNPKHTGRLKNNNSHYKSLQVKIMNQTNNQIWTNNEANNQNSSSFILIKGTPLLIYQFEYYRYYFFIF